MPSQTQPKSRILLVYEPGDDTLERVVADIRQAPELDIDVDPIEELGAQGWLGHFAPPWKTRTPTIRTSLSPRDYDAVIVGTAVYRHSVTPAIRSYLATRAGDLRAVAFFCTMNTCGGWETLRDMAVLCGREPLSVFFASSREVAAARHREDVAAFTRLIHRAVRPSRPLFPRRRAIGDTLAA